MSSSENERRASEAAQDRQLVGRIRGGDKAAFEKLFRHYFADLCAFAERYVRSSAVAEDLVHDVFCDLWDRRDVFRPGGGVRAYLFQAVRNKAYNQLKRQRVRRDWRTEQKQEEVPVAADAAESTERTDLKKAMDRAIEDLSERQQVVFQMAHYHDLTYAEIATVLDISPKTVENHMGRALKRLRERLAPFLTLLFAML